MLSAPMDDNRSSYMSRIEEDDHDVCPRQHPPPLQLPRQPHGVGRDKPLDSSQRRQQFSYN